MELHGLARQRIPARGEDRRAACDALGLKLKVDTYEASTTLRISRPEETG